MYSYGIFNNNDLAWASSVASVCFLCTILLWIFGSFFSDFWLYCSLLPVAINRISRSTVKVKRTLTCSVQLLLATTHKGKHVIFFLLQTMGINMKHARGQKRRSKKKSTERKKSDWNTKMIQLQVATLRFRLKWPEMWFGIKRDAKVGWGISAKWVGLSQLRLRARICYFQ